MDDYWVGDYLVAGADTLKSKSYTLSLNHVDTDSEEAVLAVSLQGASSTDNDNEHQLSVMVNGTGIGTYSFAGLLSATAQFSFDASLLSDGNNTVSITADLGDGIPYSIVYINEFDLSYHRHYKAEADTVVIPGLADEVVTVGGFTEPEIVIFDITQSETPKKIKSVSNEQGAGNYCISFKTVSGHTYLALAESGIQTPLYVDRFRGSLLKNKFNAYDYIIIAPEEMASAAEYHAEYRKSTGYRVLVVTPERIMNTFNHGIQNPEAIKTFLGYASQNWFIKPKYVVLAGDGTYDYKNHTENQDSVLPPVMVKNQGGLFPSDNWLVDISGNDGVPDIAVGRIPVVTADEYRRVVDRLKAYESSDNGDWKKKLLFVNDNNDSGGEFENATKILAGFSADEYNKTILSLGERTKDEIHTSILSELNSGSLFMNYMGHGGLNQFTGENVFNSDDISTLTNEIKMPIVSAMTCFTGNFSIPGYDSLGEAFVTGEQGGAVAVLAPSGKMVNPNVMYLNKAFVKALFASEGSAVIGDVMKEACSVYLKQIKNPDILRVYTLFGDPATRVIVNGSGETN